MQAKTIDKEKNFRTPVKPLFSNRNSMCEMTTLIEKGKILSTDKEITECFNEKFTNITDSLYIDPLNKEAHEQLIIHKMFLKAITDLYFLEINESDRQE